MPSSPPPAGTAPEELEVASGEASLPLHAAETGAGGERGAPSASEDQADGSDDGEEGDAMEADGDGGWSDDSAMEVGELEDEEEEDSAYSSEYWEEYDEEHFAADLQEGVDGAREDLQKNAEDDGEGRQRTNPAVASCCVCMEPWTSGGAHRICCIPCGHVYGRSCLEKWLRRCGGTKAKCPQCGESFEGKMIINLYGTEYLWNDCIHDQARLDEEKRLRDEEKRLREESERMQLEAFEEAMAAWQEERHRFEALDEAFDKLEDEYRAKMDEYNEAQRAHGAYNSAFQKAMFAYVNSGGTVIPELGPPPPPSPKVPMIPLRREFYTAYVLGAPAYCGLPPPPVPPTLPPLSSPHTHHPSDAGSNEP